MKGPMQRLNYIIIANLKDYASLEMLKEIKNVYNIELEIENSEIMGKCIVTTVATQTDALDVINRINAGSMNLRAYDFGTFEKFVNSSIYEQSDLKLLESSNLIEKQPFNNEMFIIAAGFELYAVENKISEEITTITLSGIENGYKVSNTSRYIILFGEITSIRRGINMEVYFNIYEEYTGADFNTDDSIMALYSNNKTDLYNLNDMSKIYGIPLKSSILFSDLQSAFYVEEMNKFVTYKGKILNNKANITKVKSYGDKIAILTENDGNSSIIFMSSSISTQKSHLAILNPIFTFSESFLFVNYEKNVGDRELFFLECYTKDQIIMYQHQNKIVSFRVSDDYVSIFDSEFNFLIFERKKNNLVEIFRSKKSSLITIAMRKQGDVVAIFDPESDNIEIYGEGKILSKNKHMCCNGLEWSPSGTFLASFSANVTFGGVIQMYTANGKCLWKHNFTKLTNFEWCNFRDLDGSVKYNILENYDELVKSLPDDHLEIINDQHDIEFLKNSWLQFLKLKQESFLS